MKGDKQEQRQSSGKQNADPQPYHREVRTPYSLAAIWGKKNIINHAGRWVHHPHVEDHVLLLSDQPPFSDMHHQHDLVGGFNPSEN